MRRIFASVVGPVVIVATWALGAVAQDATYESRVLVRADDLTVGIEQSLFLPLSRLPGLAGGEADPSDENYLVLRQTLPADGRWSWSGALAFERGALSTKWFLRHPHDTSSDPFRLVHESAYGESSTALSAKWSGPWSAAVQHVSAVPLRGGDGPLYYAQVASPSPPAVRLSALAYGTSRLRHRFIALDGRWDVGRWRFHWGTARQDGEEVVAAAGGTRRTTLDESARFLRLETSWARHRTWLLVHDTTGGFRSLAASAYPFRRGARVVEGRWQWRPAANRLVSVYGQRRAVVDGSTYDELEIGFSSMPRRRWGWRIDWETSWQDTDFEERAWTVTLTDPGRRWEQTMTLSMTAEGARRRRMGLRWDDGSWRVRLVVDDGLPGWRLEWRQSPEGPWEAVVVLKQRAYAGRGVVSWVHASLTRHVPEFGQLWVQWREPDQGRLDTGWNRPPAVGAGVRVFF